MKIDRDKLRDGLEKLTGEDYEQAERTVRFAGDATIDINYSKAFQAALAAKAMGIPRNDMLAMHILEYINTVNVVRDFLLNSHVSEVIEQMTGVKDDKKQKHPALLLNGTEKSA